MKFNHYILLVFVLFSFGCTKESGRHLMDMSYEVRYDIPAGLDNITTHYFIINDISTQFVERLNISGASEDEIIKIEPKNCKIEPLFQNVDYGFIQDISIRLFNDDNPKSEAFYLENIKFNEPGELKLLNSLTNLKEILSNSKFDLEIRINFKTFTPTTSENIIKLNFSAFAES